MTNTDYWQGHERYLCMVTCGLLTNHRHGNHILMYEWVFRVIFATRNKKQNKTKQNKILADLPTLLGRSEVCLSINHFFFPLGFFFFFCCLSPLNLLQVLLVYAFQVCPPRQSPLLQKIHQPLDQVVGVIHRLVYLALPLPYPSSVLFWCQVYVVLVYPPLEIRQVLLFCHPQATSDLFCMGQKWNGWSFEQGSCTWRTILFHHDFSIKDHSYYTTIALQCRHID